MNAFRKDFPVLRDNKYAYLDSAATAQRPEQVLKAVEDFYSTANANPLRGLYELSIKATDAYEDARKRVAKFIDASFSEEVIFTKNTTESLNLVAYSYGRAFVNEGDEILIAVSEHHSNIIPWQTLAKEKNAKLVYLYPNEKGEYSIEEVKAKVNEHTKIFAMAQVSNVLGIPKPIKEYAKIAHSVGAVMVVDGAQSTPHMKVSVRDMDADFFAFSGHKLMAPMGIGVLYGKKGLLEKMPPFLTGGEMIEYVTEQTSTFAEVPHKFEAGTVNAAGAVGLSAAIDYLESVGFDYIAKTEEKLTEYLLDELKKVPHITVYGSDIAKEHMGIVTFNVDDCHPHDVASILDADNVCIRAGHHCAQPLMQFMKVNATNRASLYFYNTEEDVNRFLTSIKNVRKELGYGS
ncbi:MAG: cysteine desulfurase [Lachnospiraceae bacterium]|nr:cysteine desulfurase [Lachnospiraceae bacterium]